MKRTPLVRKTPMPPSGPIKRKADKLAKHKRSMKTAAACANKEKTGRSLSRSEIAKLALVEWAKLVKLHAKGICEWCGKPATDAHHMIAKAQGNALKFTIENGVALCKGCHHHFHSKESLTGWTLFKAQRPGSFEVVEAKNNTTVKLSIGELRAIRADLRAQVKEFE